MEAQIGLCDRDNLSERVTKELGYDTNKALFVPRGDMGLIFPDMQKINYLIAHNESENRVFFVLELLDTRLLGNFNLKKPEMSKSNPYQRSMESQLAEKIKNRNGRFPKIDNLVTGIIIYSNNDLEIAKVNQDLGNGKYFPNVDPLDHVQRLDGYDTIVVPRSGDISLFSSYK